MFGISEIKIIIELILKIIIEPMKLVLSFSIMKDEQKYNRISKLYELIYCNENNQSLLISEIFKDLYSLQMNSDNVIALLKDKNAILIIYLLRKYENLFAYKNGKLIYLESKNFRKFKKYLIHIAFVVLGLLFYLITNYVINSNVLMDKLVYCLVIRFIFFIVPIFILYNSISIKSFFNIIF